MEVYILEGHPAAAEADFERTARECGRKTAEELRCVSRFWADYFSGDLDSPWREESAECRQRLGPFFFLIHRMAVLSGRLEEARSIEGQIRESEYRRDEEGEERKLIAGLLNHLEGVRLLAEGDVDGAIEGLEKADELFYYWGQNQGIAKLYNRLNLAGAYELAGDEERSREVVEEVRKVNPHFAMFYEEVRDEFQS